MLIYLGPRKNLDFVLVLTAPFPRNDDFVDRNTLAEIHARCTAPKRLVARMGFVSS